jgi:hypothetical protein
MTCVSSAGPRRADDEDPPRPTATADPGLRGAAGQARLSSAMASHDTSLSCVAEFSSMGSRHAACGGACGGWVRRPTHLPAGPIPLAARGLAAVLARAGLAGAVVPGAPSAGGGASLMAVHRAWTSSALSDRVDLQAVAELPR